ncbi:MAG: DUF3408 domain-containing protein [Bacteroidia bacterium]|nr:DUF3408 domain-containing protein [Bacteroidia bacterium]
MSTIEEQRNKVIAEQIRKMAGMEPEETKPEEVRLPKERQEKPQEKPSPKTLSFNIDLETYMETFLNPCIIENRVSFSLNRETLDVFRHILHDLRSKTTLSAYIENILREHLSRHKDVIGKGIEKNKRKPIIP